MRSFIFNFKFILFFFLTIFILNFISNIFYIHILNNSEFRLSKILINKEALNSKLIFIGNSRSVEFNKNISDEIFNSSYNGLAYEQIDLLIEKINEKNNNHTNPIYIEVSSLYDEDLLRCDFIIYLKNSKKNNCKKILTFSNYFPSYLFSNEIFLRNIYFYLFKNKDQYWSNNYRINQDLCDSDIELNFINLEKIDKSIEHIKLLKNKYKNNNFIFFLSPILKKSTQFSEYEKIYKNNIGENFKSVGKKLGENFFNNCSYFSDRIHLSLEGARIVYKAIN